MGLVVGKQAATNAEKFNDALYKCKGVLQGLQHVIGEALMPVITGLAEQFSSFVKENREKVIEFGGKVVEVLVAIVEKTAYGVGLMIDSWRGLKMVFQVIKIALNEYYKFF